VNSKLVEMWPAVRNTPEDYDGFADAVATINSLQSSIYMPNVPAWASHTSLRCWVDIQQQFLALHVSGEWSQLFSEDGDGAFDDDDEHTDDKFTFKFFEHAVDAAVRDLISEVPLLRSGQHVLKWLQPNDDSDLLDEVSQFMAVNIAGYRHCIDQQTFPRRYELRPIVWMSDRDSNDKTSLEYMAEQQSIALSGGASKEFVLDPSLEYDAPACNLIERKLFMDGIRHFDYKDWTDGIRSWEATPI